MKAGLPTEIAFTSKTLAVRYPVHLSTLYTRLESAI